MYVSIKKTIIALVMLLILITTFLLPSYALSDKQSLAIQTLLDDACSISGAPGMSVFIVDGNETYFFSSGFANREEKSLTNENTLFELASVSKAFTGMGILLLEEEGLLSMSDSINKYLPWLTFQYNGENVDMADIKLNNFLHHTSGITNLKHGARIPEGNSLDMLQKTVEVLVDAELAFSPGERYEYGGVYEK